MIARSAGRCENWRANKSAALRVAPAVPPSPSAAGAQPNVNASTNASRANAFHAGAVPRFSIRRRSGDDIPSPAPPPSPSCAVNTRDVGPSGGRQESRRRRRPACSSRQSSLRGQTMAATPRSLVFEPGGQQSSISRESSAISTRGAIDAASRGSHWQRMGWPDPRTFGHWKNARASSCPRFGEPAAARAGDVHKSRRSRVTNAGRRRGAVSGGYCRL